MSTPLSKQGAAIRTFLAAELPSRIRDDLGRLESDFVDHASALKWSSSILLHITLHFLGGLTADRVAAAEEAACAAAGECRPFTLHLSGLGAFPSESSPRVIWVGLARGAGYLDLEYLHSRASAALAARGFHLDERPFSPHITLARTRDTVTREDRQGIASALGRVKASRVVEGSFEVDHLTVMRSDLSPRGPRYTPMAVYGLGAVNQRQEL
jgi:2'-5' RNA ligase